MNGKCAVYIVRRTIGEILFSVGTRDIARRIVTSRKKALTSKHGDGGPHHVRSRTVHRFFSFGFSSTGASAAAPGSMRPCEFRFDSSS